MTRQEITAFFDGRLGAWKQRDPNLLASGHAADGTIESPMFGRRRGREAILDTYKALFVTFPDWDFEAEDLLIDGDNVAQAFSATATQIGDFMGLSGTNRRFRIQGARLFTMAGGFIVHERRMYDFTGLLIQIGVLKGKPAKE